MNIDIEELERKASEVSGWSGCTVLELVGEVRRLRTELAAAQAREKLLREALMHCSTDEGPEQAWVNAAREALALPIDDTALRQAIRSEKDEMRERCANACITSCDTVQALQAIRALEVE
jgi:hypothetical protein